MHAQASVYMGAIVILGLLSLAPTRVLSVVCTTMAKEYKACRPDKGVCCSKGLVCTEQFTVAWKRYNIDLNQYPVIDLVRGNPSVTQCRKPVYTALVPAVGRRRALLADEGDSDSQLDSILPGQISSRSLLQATATESTSVGVCGPGWIAARLNSFADQSITPFCSTNDDCPADHACWDTSDLTPRICRLSYFSTSVSISSGCAYPAKCQAKLAIKVCNPHPPQQCWLKLQRYAGFYGHDRSWFNGKTPLASASLTDRVEIGTIDVSQSALWTGQIRPDVSGNHTFVQVADDASDLFIDDNHVLTASYWAAASGTIHLNAGQTYNITVMFGNAGSYGFLNTRWAGPDGYFATSLQPILVCHDCPQTLQTCYGRCFFTQQRYIGYHGEDPTYFYPPNAPYVEVLSTDVFTDSAMQLSSVYYPTESVRWTGLLKIDITGTYTFRLEADDRAYVFLDGNMILTDDPYTPRATTELVLEKGSVHWLEVLWGNINNVAYIKLEWTLARSTSWLTDFSKLLACPVVAGCPPNFRLTPDGQCEQSPGELIASVPPGYVRCAEENQVCCFTGKQNVVYGVDSRFFLVSNVTSPFDCTNQRVKGDPAIGLGKFCAVPAASAASCSAG